MEKYRRIKILGLGSSGEVWEALNQETGEIVAIKTTHLERRYSSMEDCVNNLREIKCQRNLRHENIVRLQDVIFPLMHPIESVHLVLESMECNLDEIIEYRLITGNPFSETQIRNFAFQILKGLSYMHEQGYIHRDIKPANLLVSNGTIIKIADFGLAREVGSSPPYTPCVGTKTYRAPEMTLTCKNNYTTAIDIWAVGAVIGEMFCLLPLFRGRYLTEIMAKMCSVIGSPTEISWIHGILQAMRIHYEFPEMKASKIEGASVTGESLIRWMCSWDPLKRPTASEAMLHPFFKDCNYIPRTITLQTIAKLDSCMTELRKSSVQKQQTNNGDSKITSSMFDI